MTTPLLGFVTGLALTASVAAFAMAGVALAG